MSEPGFETAMVFAAGLGSRMAPITRTLPKPLVKIDGRTMLDHMLDRLADAGVQRAVVNVHYLADQIEYALVGRQHPQIIVSDERARLLDQGGGIKKALPALGAKPFILCNTDALWIENGESALDALARVWDPLKMDILLLLADRSQSIGVDWDGDFFIEPNGALRKRQSDEMAPYVYAGVGIFKPELVAGESADVFRLAPYFFDAARQGRLHGVVLDGQWLHVGTPQAIAPAEGLFRQSRGRRSRDNIGVRTSEDAAAARIHEKID